MHARFCQLPVLRANELQIFDRACVRGLDIISPKTTSFLALSCTTDFRKRIRQILEKLGSLSYQKSYNYFY